MRKLLDIPLSALTGDMALAAFELVEHSPKESGQLLWNIYQHYKSQKMEHIFDPRISVEAASLFVKLVNTEGADRLSAKKRDAIMRFVRDDPLMSEKYLNRHSRPLVPLIPRS